MDRIERKMQDERNFAKKVLAWLSCTKNELTVRQLQHALGVEEDEDKDLDRDNLPDAEDLVSACTGLVVIDQPTGVVRLVHHTTDEYFARNWEKWFSTAHREIATTCLRYASYTPLQSCCATKEDLTERLQRYPLYGYVATYWGDHAREQMPLKDLVLGFLRPPTRLSALTQAAVKHLFGSADLSASPQDIHGLHVAAYFGLVEIVTTLIEEGVTVSVRDSAGETALMWAARGGHAAMADLLLTTDLDPNIRNNAGQTAIDVACKRNNKAFVCRLLEVRVDIATSVRNLMVWAAENGYQDVVTLLLDQGHSPNFHPRDLVRRRPPLIWAIIRGHDDLARLLLEHGADVEQEDKAGHTAIIAAVRFARRDLIRPILDRGTDPCEGSEGYVSAVEQTVSHSDFESMELILQDQERRGQGKKTCITLMLSAMRWNNVNVMKRMIELGMGVNEFCLRGDTPLLLASRLVVIDAISLFLDHGADPNVADQDGKRPLSLVASFDIFSWPPALKYSPNETLEMAVNLLVEKGAVVDIRDNKQQTPLILAAHHHNEGVIGALIKHGADVMAEDQSGRTVLSRLAGGSRCGVYDPTAIAQLIIDQGADIHQMDHTGRSAASHAAEKGQAGILQLLIEKGNNINTPDHHGKTPLLWATTQNKNVCAVMEVLFDSGTDPNLCDQDGRTPLIEAVVHESHYLKDRKKKVTLLLDHGADLHLRDSQGRTALSYAAAYRDTEIVRLLVDWGADIGTEDNEGRTPLFYAVQKPALAWMEKSHEPLEVLKSLLSKKIDATTLVEES
jgi:ankyrin repeat protein